MAVAISYQPFAGLTGKEQIIDYWNDLEEVLKHYLSQDVIAQVLRAAAYGARAHEGQMRQSGEPYFIHPIAVTKILAGQRFDLPVLQAALLHDVLEDTQVTRDEMAAEFGEDVTALVDGVSKLDRLKNQAPQEVQAESFKKMFVATTDDPRVIIIKLADRLHNMQTLGALRPDKRVRKARETLDIYASIAGRLGLFYFRMQLEDLAFSHLHPWRYAVLQKHYAEMFASNDVMDKLHHDLMPAMEKMGIRATITKRQRHLWGVYQRMKRKNRFTEACRTVPVRIITTSVDDCYRILGILHNCYRPINNKFEDYIAAPKSNGYRSLHTSVVAFKNVLNVQIRTREMHSLAETGIIAVWHQHLKNQSVRKDRHTIAAEKYMRDWLSRLREVQNITDNPLEFYDAIKKELNSGDIAVYTPKGAVIDLPSGATPVDFAYAIHTEIGNRCYAAKVNGLPYQIFRPLETGQTCEILTRKDAHPHAGWLQFVVTAKARAGVNHHLRTLENQEARSLGRFLFEQALLDLGYSFERLAESTFSHYLAAHGLNEDKLFVDIAYGHQQAGLVAAAMLGKKYADNVVRSALTIHSANDTAIHLADCCHPLPKESIVGNIEAGRGIAIHRQNCTSARISDSQGCLRVEWDEQVEGTFISLLYVDVLHKPKMLSAVADVIAHCESNIADFKVEQSASREDERLFKIWLEVRSRDHLAQIIRGLRLVKGVSRIERS